MGRYLDKFQGIVGKIQAKQILQILNKKRDTGQIRSVKEFSKELETLMRELTSTGLVPSLSLFMAEPDKRIDSETFNFQLDRVDDDLEAAFEEAKQIDKVQRSHEAIVRDVLLKNIRAGLAELETRITLYEFLASDTRGFDAAIFSSFREAGKNRSRRGDTEGASFFSDYRLNDEFITAEEDATVELVGERLTLPHDNSITHPVRSVRRIFDSDTPRGDLSVVPSFSDLQNVIDNTKGTYWAEAILFTEQRASVQYKLELNLGATQDVNVIDIEPISRQGIYLKSIHFENKSGELEDLGITEILLTGPSSLKIKKTASNRFILTFRNENYVYINFQYNEEEETLLLQAVNEPSIGISPALKKVSTDLNKAVSSGKIKEVLGISSLEKSTFSGYEYIFGFDNIRFGLVSYRERGVYISSPMEIEDLGELGLKTIESRPYVETPGVVSRTTTTTYDLDSATNLDETPIFENPDDIHFLGSIEYWVIKQDRDPSGLLLKTSSFPILPLGVDRIFHERLILSEKSSSALAYRDIGYPIFFTNTSSTEGNLKLYLNRVEVAQDAFWEDISTVADRTPNNNRPMRFAIKLLFQPGPEDIITISYNPLVSSTPAVPQVLEEVTSSSGLFVVDLEGDLTVRHLDENIITLGKTTEIQKISSKVYLVIILRRNTVEESLTPAVEEYLLLGGYKDREKFREL